MDSSAEPGASIGTSKLLCAENGPVPPNSGTICGLRQRKLRCPKSPRPSTSAFADIKRMIDEPEWEAFHKDLSSSDFETIRVATQEPEACSDYDGNFLDCGSGTKNGGNWKHSENSLSDYPDSPSCRHDSKRVKTETEQSMETCEREKDRELEILALSPIGLNVRNCSVKTEELALNSNSYAVCPDNSDVRKPIKQEPEWSSILESPFPTLDSENQSRVALNGNCEPGMAESVQDSSINNQVSSIGPEKLSLKQESEPLEECADPSDRAFTVSDSAHCNTIAADVISPISKLDPEQDTLLSNNASDAVLLSYVKAEPITEDSIAEYPVQLFNNELEHKNFDLVLKDTVPSTGSDHDENMATGCSRPTEEKFSYKKHSDDDESSPKVSSEDGDISDEDFEPDEQPSDDDDEVELVKSLQLPKPYEELIDEQLLEEIVDAVKSNPLFKPFCESELESLAPEVVKLWKTDRFINCGAKSIISRYIKQEPKYLQMLKTYVHDGTDEDAIRLLPVCFKYGSERIQLRVKCPVCSTTVTKRLFQYHMNNHANCRPYMCEKCGSRFLTEGALITHEKETKCSGTRFECKVCGKVYGCKRGLHLHEKSHKCCHMCDAVFDLPASLKEHMVCHTNDKDLDCNHSQTHVEKARLPKECKKCNAKFESWYQYLKHVHLHNKGTEKPLQCPHCDKRFVVHSTLKDHIRTHTGEKPHKCDICGSAFAQKSSMNTHRLTHQDKRLYCCDKCGRAYRTKMTLSAHLRESTCSDKSFKCKVCGKVYGSKPGLRLHEKLHDPNKEMHKCHVCDAVFGSTSALRDHVARHGNSEDPSQLANPFQCNVCGKHLSTKRILNRHYSQIHLEKARQPKECKKCHATLPSAYEYRKHIQSHNRELGVPKSH